MAENPWNGRQLVLCTQRNDFREYSIQSRRPRGLIPSAVNLSLSSTWNMLFTAVRSPEKETRMNVAHLLHATARAGTERGLKIGYPYLVWAEEYSLFETKFREVCTAAG